MLNVSYHLVSYYSSISSRSFCIHRILQSQLDLVIVCLNIPYICNIGFRARNGIPYVYSLQSRRLPGAQSNKTHGLDRKIAGSGEGHELVLLTFADFQCNSFTLFRGVGPLCVQNSARLSGMVRDMSHTSS
jgi:hypothetical protein